MLAEAWIARQLELFESDDYEKCVELLGRFLPNFPTKSTLQILGSKARLAKLATADKKSSSGSIRMSLPEKIGKMASTTGTNAIGGEYRIPVANGIFLGSIDHVREMLRRLTVS
jgi:3-dehydroquinate synthetase